MCEFKCIVWSLRYLLFLLLILLHNYSNYAGIHATVYGMYCGVLKIDVFGFELGRAVGDINILLENCCGHVNDWMLVSM